MITHEKVYIRLLDGVETLVPINAQRLDENVYLLHDNSLMDLENDATSIWEFFPTDIVKCSVRGNQIYAQQLIESSFPERKLHSLIFNIVIGFGDVSDAILDDFRDEILKLCDNSHLIQKQHPLVLLWLKQHCAKYK